MINLNGIFPPLPTAFNSDEEIALAKMADNIEKLLKHDLAGILVLGSNGELVNLSHEEKIQVFEMGRNAVPKNKVLLAGTGAQSTRETIILTKAAAQAGVDAALVLNPSYYKGLMTEEALVYHYHSVADASPIPIIVYNMPASSGLDMSAETILKISNHPNIIGVKDSGGNLSKMGAIKYKAKPDFQILAGSAGFLLPTLAIGAVGGILASANIAPQKCLSIYNAFKKGAMGEAQKNQHEIIELNNSVTAKFGIPALKFAMDQLGYYGGFCRKPIQAFKKENESVILELLQQNNLI